MLRTTVGGGVALLDAVQAATATPAAVLGRADLGVLAVGRRADVLVLDAGLRVHAVARAGIWVDIA